MATGPKGLILLRESGILPPDAISATLFALQQRQQKADITPAQNINDRRDSPGRPPCAVIPVADKMAVIDDVEVFLTSVELWMDSIFLNSAVIVSGKSSLQPSTTSAPSDRELRHQVMENAHYL